MIKVIEPKIFKSFGIGGCDNHNKVTRIEIDECNILRGIYAAEHTTKWGLACTSSERRVKAKWESLLRDYTIVRVSNLYTETEIELERGTDPDLHLPLSTLSIDDDDGSPWATPPRCVLVVVRCRKSPPPPLDDVDSEESIARDQSEVDKKEIESESFGHSASTFASLSSPTSQVREKK